MNSKPKLVVMAAGLGSRYGGLKQVEPVTSEGEIILDFAVYDAMEAGFDEVIFVIKPEMENDFVERVINPIKDKIKCHYVFQQLSQLPEGYHVPEQRIKPWGTCHAVMACHNYLDGPFAVINSDDYYGKSAFSLVYDFLSSDSDENQYCMAGYLVENTLSEQGTVTRGVCQINDNGYLINIKETKDIGLFDGVIMVGNVSKEGNTASAESADFGDSAVFGAGITPKCLENTSKNGEFISPGTVVSMNFWGFKASFLDKLSDRFPSFLDEILESDPLKGEYLLPIEVERLLSEKEITVKVLKAQDKWYGVTYKEDKAKVTEAFAKMKAKGKYPARLWKNDGFDKEISFGTAGLRGIMAPGPGRMNRQAVAKATQAISDFLGKSSGSSADPLVIISYDSRNHSREFAEEAAGVLSANGIRNKIFTEITPVPVLSYAIRTLNADIGIMITASHNSREYNGYKVYNHTGGQILENEASVITEGMQSLDSSKIRTMAFKDACMEKTEFVSEKVLDDFVDTVASVGKISMNNMGREEDISLSCDINVVYTPLNGSGAVPVKKLLKKTGFRNVFTVLEQENPDGNFSTCNPPNPEMQEVYSVALKYAENRNADIILATDPDCDRAGVMIKNHGEYSLLSGNEIGILLFNYICETRDKVSGKVLVSSITSTPMADLIAQNYGVNVVRTLVGFKYIGQQIEILGDNFLMGFEESNGFLMGRYARDKDAALAVYMISQMTAYYKKKGKTLKDVLNELYSKYGTISSRTFNIDMPGSAEMSEIAHRLRSSSETWKVLGPVSDVKDYLENSHTKLPPANVLEVHLADRTRIIIRPSGTEPKMKVYISVYGKDEKTNMERISGLINQISEMLQTLML